MSQSPLRIIVIAILLLAVFAFFFVFLYLGMQGLVEQQRAASSEAEISSEETYTDMSSEIDPSATLFGLSESDTQTSDTQESTQSDWADQN